LRLIIPEGILTSLPLHLLLLLLLVMFIFDPIPPPGIEVVDINMELTNKIYKRKKKEKKTKIKPTNKTTRLAWIMDGLNIFQEKVIDGLCAFRMNGSRFQFLQFFALGCNKIAYLFVSLFLFVLLVKKTHTHTHTHVTEEIPLSMKYFMNSVNVCFFFPHSHVAVFLPR
jgi:hypothetical protein